MEFRNAFKWSLLYRGVATGAFLLGIVLVGLGVVAGFGSAVSTLLADPLNPGDAIAQANPTLTIAFCVLGFVVWQFGKTYALFVTVPRAAGRSAAKQFDTERVKSELLEVLDDRLAEIHEDVERTRLAVDEIERERAADRLAADELEDDPAATEHAATYDESETLESSSAGASSASAESGVPSSTSGTASAADSTADGSAASGASDESTRNGDADYGADAAESDEPLN